MFKDKLNDVLCSLNLTQAQLASMTGIGRSSISQYCSGKNVPTKARQTEIAEALGLESDYFEREVVGVAAPTAKKNNGVIPRLLPAEAAKLMGLAERTVTAGLRDGVFPWGYAIHGTGDKWIYFINAKRFAEIEGISI